MSSQLGDAVLDLEVDLATYDANLDRAKAKTLAAMAEMQRMLDLRLRFDTGPLGMVRQEVERGLLGPLARLSEAHKRTVQGAADAEVMAARRVAHAERERTIIASGDRGVSTTGAERSSTVVGVPGPAGSDVWGVRGPDAPGSRMNPIVVVLEAAQRTPLGSLAAAIGDSSTQGGPESTTVATSRGSETRVTSVGSPASSEKGALSALEAMRTRSEASFAERLAESKRILSDLESGTLAAKGAKQSMPEAPAASPGERTIRSSETTIRSDKTTVVTEGDRAALGAALSMGSRVQKSAILRQLAKEGRGGEVETLLAAGNGGEGGGNGGLLGLLGAAGGNSGDRNNGMMRKLLWGTGGVLGLAGMGTLGSMAGFGLEHVLFTGAGLLGSATSGLLGGGLLALGAAGKMGVGMGSDLAVMKSTITDTKSLQQAYDGVAKAVAIYGKNSEQAKVAQKELNYLMVELGNTAGVKAEMGVAKAGEALNQYWDKATSGARVQASKILMQGLGLGRTYIPSVANAAEQNLALTNQGLKPLFHWLEGPEGLGIFNQLEVEFRSQIPQALHATDEGFQLVAKTIAHMAPYTGKIVSFFDEFFTKWNGPQGFTRWETMMGKLIDDFHLWANFLKALGGSIWDLFKNDAQTGNTIILTLTGMLDKLRAWEKSTSGSAELHNIFQVHKEEVVALLNLIPPLVKAVEPIYMTIAPVLVHLVTGLAEALASVLEQLDKLGPVMRDTLGGALILGKLGLLKGMIGGLATSLGIITVKEKTLNETTLGEFVAAQNAVAASMVRTGAAATVETTEIEALGTAMGSVASTSAADTAVSGGLFGGIAGKLTGRLGPTVGGAAAGGEATGLAALLANAGPALLKGGLYGAVGGLLGNTVASVAGVHGTANTAISLGGVGAGIGTAVMPGIGTAIGAVLGAGIGAAAPTVIKALTGLFSKGVDAAERAAKKRAHEYVGLNPNLTPAESMSFQKQLEGASKETDRLESRVALDRERSGGSRIEGASAGWNFNWMKPGNIGVDRRNLQKAYENEGHIAGQAFVKGMEHTPIKTRTTVLWGMEEALDKLKPQARKKAAETMLGYAAELEREGTLPVGSVEHITKKIMSYFPHLSLYAKEQGKNFDRKLAEGFEMHQSQAALNAALKNINKMFGQSFAENASSEVKAMSELRAVIAESAGPQKHALEMMLDGMETSYHRFWFLTQKKWREEWSKIAAHPTEEQRKTFISHIEELMDAGLVSTQKGIRQINQQLEGELGALGMPHSMSKALITGGKTTNFKSEPTPFATGGLMQIGRAGEAGHDNVPLNVGGTPVVVAPGEQVAVFNRHQLPIVNAALDMVGYGGLEGLFSAIQTPHYMAKGGLVRMISEANRINSARYPYTWGGGHNANFAGPFDCSGAVSAVLHAGGYLSHPEVSGELMSFGAPGPGAVTIYASPQHTFMSIDGRFFGTHGSSGAGWYAGSPLTGYAVRHVPLGAGEGIGGIRVPKVLGRSALAHIVQGGLKDATKAANRYARSHINNGMTGGASEAHGAYSRGMLEALWTHAGGNSRAKRMAAAIALAESAGNPQAYGVATSGGHAEGLWQIMMPLNAGYVPGGNPYVPSANARAAVRLSGNGTNWRPWETYDTGVYRRFMAKGGLLFASKGMTVKPKKPPAGLPKRAKRAPRGLNINAMHFNPFRLIPSLLQMPVSFNQDLTRLNQLMGQSGLVAGQQEHYSVARSTDERALSEQPYGGQFIVTSNELGETVAPFEDTGNVEMHRSQWEALRAMQFQIREELEEALSFVGPLEAMAAKAVLYRRKMIETIKHRLAKLQEAVNKIKRAVKETIERNKQKIEKIKNHVQKLREGKLPAYGKNGKARESAQEIREHKITKLEGEQQHLEGWNRSLEEGKLPPHEKHLAKEVDDILRNVGLSPVKGIAGAESEVKKTAQRLEHNRSQLTSQIGTLEGYVTVPNGTVLGGFAKSGSLPDTRTQIVGLSGIGGQLGEAQSTLAGLNRELEEVGAPALEKKLAAAKVGAGKTNESELSSLLKQQNEELAKQVYVSQQQYKVFANLPPFGGSFALGGVVPGALGEPRTIIAHGGERILKDGQDNVHVHLHVEDGAVDKSKIRTIVRDENRRTARHAGQRRPSAGGVMI